MEEWKWFVSDCKVHGWKWFVSVYRVQGWKWFVSVWRIQGWKWFVSDWRVPSSQHSPSQDGTWGCVNVAVTLPGVSDGIQEKSTAASCGLILLLFICSLQSPKSCSKRGISFLAVQSNYGRCCGSECSPYCHSSQSGEGGVFGGGKKESWNNVLQLLFLGRCIGQHWLQGRLWSFPRFDLSLVRELQPRSRHWGGHWLQVHPRGAGRRHPCLTRHSTLASLLQLQGKTSTATSHGPRNMISPCPSEGVWLLFQRMTRTDVALC